MNSLRVFTIFLVVYTAHNVLGLSNNNIQDGSHRKFGGSISKRSIIELRQIVPWMQSRFFRSTNGTDTNASSSTSSASGFGTGIAQYLGLTSLEGTHNISRRSIGEPGKSDSIVEKIQQLFRTLPSRESNKNNHGEGLDLNGFVSPKRHSPQTILFLRHEGPVSLLRPGVQERPIIGFPALGAPSPVPLPGASLSAIRNSTSTARLQEESSTKSKSTFEATDNSTLTAEIPVTLPTSDGADPSSTISDAADVGSTVTETENSSSTTSLEVTSSTPGSTPASTENARNDVESLLDELLIS